MIFFMVGCGNEKAPVKEETASPAPAAEEKTESKTSEWPRTITDAVGHEIVLEKKPERIAILHSMYLEYFLALESAPIASTGSSRGDAMKALETWETIKPYVGKNEIIDLGSARDINLEAILAAKPDVIVTFKGQGNLDKIYDQLIQIAPVIQIDFQDTWQKQTLDCAAIVGKEELAQEIIQETEKSIDEAKALLSQKSDKKLAIFRTDGKGFIPRGDQKYYETFGLTIPENYPLDYQMISLETLSEMNPDYIVFQDFKDAAVAFTESQAVSSVWQSLKAVKDNKVFYFDDSLNTFGPLALKLTAEKLVDIFQE